MCLCLAQLNQKASTPCPSVQINQNFNPLYQQSMQISSCIRFCSSRYLSQLYNHSVKTKTPFFTTSSDMIEIIEDPLEFYLTIRRSISYVYRRVALSSLYMGQGPLEQHLLSTLANRMDKIPSLTATMVFDFNRSTRIDKNTAQSPASILRDFRYEHPQNEITVGLYKQSKRLKTMGEIQGVHHQKIYIFDDTLIIGGANLSHNYFLNRRDRYLVIKNHPQLCDYMHDYLKIIADNCQLQHQILNHKDPDKKMKITGGIFNYSFTANKKKTKSRLEKQLKLWLYSYRAQEYKSTIEEQEAYLASIERERQAECKRNIVFKDDLLSTEITLQSEKRPIINRNDAIAAQIGGSIVIRPVVDQQKRNVLKQQARERLFKIKDHLHIGNQIAAIEQKAEKNHLAQKGEKVYLFPSMMLRQFKLDQEQELFNSLIRIANEQKHKVKLSCGYFNLSEVLKKELFTSNGKDLTILCSSPLANSFFRAEGFKKYIPFFYRCFEYDILSRYPECNLKQFNNHEWSFHAKGLWIKETQNSYLTAIGSSNYNKRSSKRDTEFQLYLYSSCEKFNKNLEDEWEEMSRYCEKIGIKDIEADKEIKVSLPYRLLAKLFSSYL